MHTKHVVALLITILVNLPCAGQDPEAKHKTIDVGSHLELFVDDHVVDRLVGDADYRLHRPEPKEVVLVTDKPWEGNTCAYYTIFQDGDRYRMYYRGSHADEKTKKSLHPEVTCYAESRDGIHWTKPELNLFEYQGSKANNIVWDGIGTHNFTPFRDDNPDAAPESRYKAIARGRPLGKKGLYVFQSPDAIHWELIKDEPVITNGAFDSQNLAFWDPVSRLYVDYHRTFVDGVRAIMTCTSKDFVSWTEPELLRYDDDVNQHLYTNAIRPYPRAPEIRIGFPTRFLPKTNAVEPIFMASRDGLNFRRFNQPVIPRTAPKDRDGNRSNYMANALLTLPGKKDEYSVYASEAYYSGPDSRLRRFVYRVDGFVSVHSDTSGELITQPIRFNGDRLVINYAAAPGGSVRVELQDQAGNPIDGYRLESVTPGQDDSTRHVVSWTKSNRMPPKSASPVRIRFVLENADLYSFQFTALQ